MNEKCIIQLDAENILLFLGPGGQHVKDLNEAVQFNSELDAHIYIEKNRLDRIAKVRRNDTGWVILFCFFDECKLTSVYI